LVPSCDFLEREIVTEFRKNRFGTLQYVGIANASAISQGLSRVAAVPGLELRQTGRYIAILVGMAGEGPACLLRSLCWAYLE
jgi:hypothetical protein